MNSEREHIMNRERRGADIREGCPLTHPELPPLFDVEWVRCPGCDRLDVLGVLSINDLCPEIHEYDEISCQGCGYAALAKNFLKGRIS